MVGELLLAEATPEPVLPATRRQGQDPIAPGLPDALASQGNGIAWLDGEMAEMMLLVPGRQLAALERVARSRGWTPGQVVRRLVRDFCEAAPVGANWFGEPNPDPPAPTGH